MALETTLVQTLQELREWQVNQKERLLKLQQDQINSLTIEQKKRTYEAVSQSIEGYENNSLFEGLQPELQVLYPAVDGENERIRPDKIQQNMFLSDSNEFCQSATKLELKRLVIAPEDVQARSLDCGDADIELESPKIEETPRRFRRESMNDFKLDLWEKPMGKKAIDEIPVPSSNKDVSSQREEYLKDPTNINCDVNRTSKGPESMKRPFLRKGAGLARFKMKPTPKNCSTSVIQVENPLIRTKSAPNPSKNTQILRSNAKVAQKSLDLQEFHKARVKIETVNESSHSDLDSSKLETQIFEFMEEKAENSSFCSTSSAVMAFIHQSTPTKLHNIFKNLDIASNMRRNNSTASLACIAEIPMQSQCQSGKFEMIPPTESSPIEQEFTLTSSSSSRVTSDDSDNAQEADSREDLRKKNEGVHVRFSNYDEYKTYGLTDTSISNESQETFYADQSNSDESDVEIIAENPANICPEDRQSVEEQVNMMNAPDCCSDESSNELAQDLREDLGLASVTEIVEDPQDALHAVFTSQLLKERLLELEKEIIIFRKQNTVLSQQRQRLHDEQRKEQRELKAKMENLELERAEMERSLREERARLSREKAALETRLRDARERSLQTKQERLEAAELRRQLEQLQADMTERESRAQAAQARQRSQVRVLQLENLKLKREVEQLRENRTVTKPRKQLSTNTRAIHQINQHLSEKTEAGKPNSDRNDRAIIDNGKTVAHVSEESDKLHDKRELYENLLKEVSEECENLERSKPQTIINRENFNPSDPTPKLSIESEVDEVSPRDKSSESSDISPDVRPVSLKPNSPIRQEKYQHFVEQFLSQKLTCFEQVSEDPVTSEVPKNFLVQEDKKIVIEEDPSTMKPAEMPRAIPPKRLPPVSPTKCESSAETRSNGKVLREVKHPDGHMEFWYPNGNVKRVYPDRGVTKVIYFNGDVREATADNCVKYFYAQTNTWHTTFPDGFEVLEFPDGQQERRTRSGVVEVSFPDGSIRLTQPDGVEKWALPDGTIAETFPNGDKIISLPNGQREIHTSLHKRREYPDGTIKFVYPNGAQETRYSNGRIRMRDEDGNLVMDSYQAES